MVHKSSRPAGGPGRPGGRSPHPSHGRYFVNENLKSALEWSIGMKNSTVLRMKNSIILSNTPGPTAAAAAAAARGPATRAVTQARDQPGTGRTGSQCPSR
jgi:hypothetical protein